MWRNDCENNVDGKNGLVCRVMGVNNGGIISGQRFWNLMDSNHNQDALNIDKFGASIPLHLPLARWFPLIRRLSRAAYGEVRQNIRARSGAVLRIPREICWQNLGVICCC